MTHHITLGGKLRPIRFGYKAIKRIANELNLKLTDFDKIIDSFDNIETLAYHGLFCGAEASGLPIDFKSEDIETWLDEEGFDKIQEILGLFAESQVSAAEQKTQKSSGKKKLQAT